MGHRSSSSKLLPSKKQDSSKVPPRKKLSSIKLGSTQQQAPPRREQDKQEQALAQQEAERQQAPARISRKTLKSFLFFTTEVLLRESGRKTSKQRMQGQPGGAHTLAFMSCILWGDTLHCILL